MYIDNQSKVAPSVVVADDGTIIRSKVSDQCRVYNSGQVVGSKLTTAVELFDCSKVFDSEVIGFVTVCEDATVTGSTVRGRNLTVKGNALIERCKLYASGAVIGGEVVLKDVTLDFLEGDILEDQAHVIDCRFGQDHVTACKVGPVDIRWCVNDKAYPSYEDIAKDAAGTDRILRLCLEFKIQLLQTHQ